MTARALFEILRIAEAELRCPAECFDSDLQLWGFHRPDGLAVVVGPWRNLQINYAMFGILGPAANLGEADTRQTFDPLARQDWRHAWRRTLGSASADTRFAVQAPLRQRIAAWIIEHADPKPWAGPYWLNVLFAGGVHADIARTCLLGLSYHRDGADRYSVLITEPVQVGLLQQNPHVSALSVDPIVFESDHDPAEPEPAEPEPAEPSHDPS